MANPFITALENDLEALAKWLEGEVSALWSALKTIVSTDAQTLYNDFGPDLQQIAVNIQNTQGGINLSNFISAFIAAALPVAEKEGLKLLETDWNILANAFGAQLNIPSTTGNAGNLPGGTQTGG